MAELENVKSMVADSEECAEKMVKSLKLKLDQLFENLTKQIQTFRDEQEAEIQVRIRLLEQLVGCLEYGLSAAEVVKLSGSKTQLMMYLKTIETQLSSRIRELQKSIGNDRLLKVAFEKHEVLQKLDAIETMGTLAVAKENVYSQMKQMLKLSSSFWWKVFPSFDALGIEKVKEVHEPGFNLKCGVCVDVGQMILGDVNGNKLHLFNNDNETIISSTSFRGDVKRLCYFPQHKRIFMSCYSHESFCASFDGKCIKEPFLLNSDEYVGGLQSFNGNMYIITDRKIKTFPLTVDPKYLTEMQDCFKTNTACGLNSLGIHDGELVYTTMDCEIKRTRFDGNKIYCYKNVAIKIPECIAVLPSGMVLVVDRAEKGSLHLLSEDGKRSRVLLDKFESIEDPQDIWIDLDGETFYVAGDEYIEVFKVH